MAAVIVSVLLSNCLSSKQGLPNICQTHSVLHSKYFTRLFSSNTSLFVPIPNCQTFTMTAAVKKLSFLIILTLSWNDVDAQNILTSGYSNQIKSFFLKQDGDVSERGTQLNEDINLTFLDVSPDGQNIYFVHEVNSYGSDYPESGAVSRWQFETCGTASYHRRQVHSTAYALCFHEISMLISAKISRNLFSPRRPDSHGRRVEPPHFTNFHFISLRSCLFLTRSDDFLKEIVCKT